ncbi:MAG: hypothetical protein WA130_01655 [Candidatus Methanoperedens sp.]
MADTLKVHTGDELKTALIRKPGFFHVIAKPVNAKCTKIHLSTKEIKERFMGALLIPCRSGNTQFHLFL